MNPKEKPIPIWMRIVIYLIDSMAQGIHHGVRLDDGGYITRAGYVPPYVLTRPDIGGHAAMSHLRESVAKRNIKYVSEPIPTKHYRAYAIDVDHMLRNYYLYPTPIRDALYGMANRLGRYDDLNMGPTRTNGMTATLDAIGVRR